MKGLNESAGKGRKLEYVRLKVEDVRCKASTQRPKPQRM